jgi:hypothetical protein
MDIEVVQALIVLLMVAVEGGLFYLLARKFWKTSRQETGLMAIGLTLLFCVAVWLCKWGMKSAGRCCFGPDGWGCAGYGA